MLSYVVTIIITVVGTSETTDLTPGLQAAELSRCPLPQVRVLFLEVSRGTAGPSPRLGLDLACCSLRTPSPLVERSMVSQFSGAGHPPASLSPTLCPGGTERPPGSLRGSRLLHPSPKFRFRDWGWGCQSVIHSLSISSHLLDVRPWDTTGKLPFSLLGASETPAGGSVTSEPWVGGHKRLATRQS